MIVECPTCKKPVEWGEKSPFRPFCSKRCRLIDLGAWADGSYSIEDQNSDSIPDEFDPDHKD